jgi:hypothetical protein
MLLHRLAEQEADGFPDSFCSLHCIHDDPSVFFILRQGGEGIFPAAFPRLHLQNTPEGVAFFQHLP